MYVSDKNGREIRPKLKNGSLVGGYWLTKGESRPVAAPELSQPVLYIDTAGGAPVTSKETYVNCTYRIVNELGYGVELFNQPGKIRGRGNSTWTMPKKPYKMKLNSKAKVLGMPKSKDWALLANYIDPSKIRNGLANEISNHTGLPWAPRSCNVEVYLNGAYQGLYQLSESVEVDNDRVDIDEIEDADTTGTNLTGGYILEVDTRFEENGEIGWRTRLNVPIIFDTPDGTVSEQYDYAKQFTQNCEDALFAEDFTAGAWRDWLDADSWADWYLVNELVANNDSGFGASVKLTKPRDPDGGPHEKLYCGPAWDFDASCGVTFFIPHPTYGWWTRVGATWIARMLEDPWFQNLLRERWALLRSRLNAETGTIFEWIDDQESLIAGAIARDATVWGNGSAPDVSSWLSSRMTWIETQLVAQVGVDTTPPDVPTGFTTTSVATTSISFSWTDSGANNGTGVVGYRIRQDGIIAAITAYPYSSPLNTATIANLTSGTQYSFTLECRDATGNWSAATAPLVVTTT